MNLHEYQGKQLLKLHAVRVPESRVAETVESAIHAAKSIGELTHSNIWAVKSQIHAGGRGKAGGIKIAKSLDEVKLYSQELLGKRLITPQTGTQGKRVHKILIEQNIYYPGENPVKELYVSILLNRSSGRYMFVYTTQGGMDIEEVAEVMPHLIFKEEINPETGLQPFQIRKIAFNLGLEKKSYTEMLKFLKGVYDTFINCDASMVEINPVVITSDELVFAADCKMAIDDNALFRHVEISEMRDVLEEDPTEVEAGRYGLNFVKLEGNVGCMVNGAGLAMATMDVIKLSGGSPANFLDVGGSANAKTVEAGFRIILKDPNVKAVLINTFGGIVRCDRVAQGIVDAYNAIGNINVPVIVRLQGTNAKEGKELIDQSGLKVRSAITLNEAAELVKDVVN